MPETKFDCLRNIDLDSLVEFAYATKLLKPRKYFTKEDFVIALARKLSLGECQTISSLYKNNISISIIADKFLREINSNAEIIKNLYIKHLFSTNQIKQVTNDVFFFEFKVGNARTDVNRVNLFSYAYEIKSGRDKPLRATYQTLEFSDIFEFVTLIVNNEEQYEHISDNVGIIKYDYMDGEMCFEQIRKPKKNLELDYQKQLNSLAALELCKILGISKSSGLDKFQLIKEVLDSFNESEINAHFKSALKDKYLDKWKGYLNRYILNS